MFFLGEYCNMIIMSAIWVILFVAGWHLPFLGYFFIGEYIFAFKTTIICAFFIIVRAALPRYRYDQLMYLGWKTLLPITLGLFVFYVSIFVGLDLLPIKEIPIFKY
jgi:NADH-quinone oxidoreductase subunit H